MKIEGNTVLITGGILPGLAAGELEVGYGFTKEISRAPRQALDERFAAMNSH